MPLPPVASYDKLPGSPPNFSCSFGNTNPRQPGFSNRGLVRRLATKVIGITDINIKPSSAGSGSRSVS